jgi:hypothetical protein
MTNKEFEADILSRGYEKLVVYDTEKGVEIAVITRGDTPVTTAGDNIVVKLSPVAETSEPPAVTGETSDGYHTFNELYRHQAVLLSVICNIRRDLAWKSKKHRDGSMYDGMFIVGIDTPSGQVTYHYDFYPYWDMFNVPELESAPEWGGHTPAQAIERIAGLGCPEKWWPEDEQAQKFEELKRWAKPLMGSLDKYYPPGSYAIISSKFIEILCREAAWVRPYKQKYRLSPF